MKKIIVELILVLIPLVAVVPFTDAEMVKEGAKSSWKLASLEQEKAKSLKWVDHKPNPRFAIYDPDTPTDEGDDLVLDKEKWLIWARNAHLVGKPLTWKDAINHCQNLALCNLRGWRLPT